MELGRRNFCKGLLALGVVLGTIPPARLATAAAEAEKGNVEFFLSEGIVFSNGTKITSIAQSDVQRLFDAPLYLEEWIEDGLELRHDDGRGIKVRTCREYRHALETGFYAATQADIKNSSIFEIPLGILEAVEKAKVPQKSYFTGFRLGPDSAKYLSASLVEFGDAPTNPGQTVQNLIDEGQVSLPELDQEGTVAFETRDMGRRFIELLRADLNDDGIEEILVFDYTYATAGSLGGGGISVMSRTDPGGPIKVEGWELTFPPSV